MIDAAHQDRLGSGVQRVSAFVCRLDRGGRITHVGAAVATVLGHSPEEFMRLSLDEWVGADHLSDVRALLADDAAGPDEVRLVECRVRHAEGSERWLEISRGDHAPGPAGAAVVVMCRDVTERRQAEEVRRARGRQLAAAESIAHTGSWEWDMLAGQVSWSDELYRIHGSQPRSVPLAPSAVLDRIHPEDRGLVREAIERATRENASLAFECRIVRDDGEVRRLVTRGEIVRRDGIAVRTIGVVQDVTELRRTEAARDLAQRQARSLIDSLSDIAFVKDAHSRYLAVNAPLARLCGVRPEEMVGRTDFDFFAPDIAARYRAADQALLARGEIVRLEEPITGADGEVRWIETIRTPLLDEEGRPAGIVGLGRDVTERIEAERSILESEAKFREIAESIRDVFWVFTADFSRTIYVSPAYETVIGQPPGEVYSRVQAFLDRVHPDDLHRLQAMMERIRIERVPAVEYRVIDPDGSVRWLLSRGFPVYDGQGEVYRVVGTTQDVTEQKAAEAALRESEERFRQLAENIDQVYWMINPEGTEYLYLSPVFEAVWGRPREWLLENPRAWLDEVVEEDLPRVLGAFTAEGTVCDNFDLTYRIRRPDGVIRWHHSRVFPLRDANGIVYRMVGITEDVTNQKLTEERLSETHRMEALGRLAGGIAHDFNNLLGVISGYADMALLDLAEWHPVRADLEEIRAAVRRAAGLTQQLLAFSRRQVVQPVKLDVNDAVREMEKMLRRLIGEDIELVTHLCLEPAMVHADATQLDQILLNLAVNARDAMPAGGVLSVDTCIVDLGEAEISRLASGAAPGPYVRISVRDTGVGIGHEALPHVFEPFFTTKEEGKGTGLGLSTVYGIVDQNGGFVEVETEVGRFTAFHVHFPSMVRGGDARPLPASPTPPVRGHGETVLLVEDEASLRSITRRVLEHSGYRVIEAENGEVALEVARRRGEEIRLLVTDVSMPRMNGRVLAERLRQDRPGLPVLFMSGYTDEAVLEHGVDGGIRLLYKPVSPEQLSRAVAKALLGSPGTGGSDAPEREDHR